MVEESKRILIIGNGPTGKIGKQVDSGDALVLRFNDFKIAGFEEQVGTRTDIHFINGSLYLFSFLPGMMWSPPGAKVIAGEPRSGIRNAQLLNERARKSDEIIIDRTPPRVPIASSGLIAIFHYLGLGYDVAIAGFLQSDAHYWVKGGVKEDYGFASGRHDAALEREIIEGLVKYGSVRRVSED